MDVEDLKGIINMVYVITTIIIFFIWLLIYRIISLYFDEYDHYEASLYILTTIIPYFNVIILILFCTVFYLEREIISCNIIKPKNRLEKIIFNIWHR